MASKLRKYIDSYTDIVANSRAIRAENIRFDAGERAAFSRQLEYVLQRSLDIKYPTLMSRQFIPVSREVPTGAEKLVYRQFDRYGEAKILNSYSDDLPLVNVFGTEVVGKIKPIGVAYEYSIQDIRAALFANTSLDEKDIMAARRAVDLAIDSLGAVGDEDAGIPGFINNSDVDLVGPDTGTWSTASADNIYNDILKLWNEVSSASNQIHMPTNLLIDTTSWQYLNRRMTDADMTIRRFLLENLPGIQGVDQWYRLDIADAAGTGPRIVAYEKSPQNMELFVPQEFEQFPPQEIDLKFRTPCHARCGGTRLYYAGAVKYMDGV